MQSRPFTSSMILALVLILGACSGDPDKIPAQKPIAVQTATVHREEIVLPIHSSGKLHKSTESKLSFMIPGIVKKIFVREGQSVSENTILASLDLIEMQARVNQARSAFRKAERDQERIKRLYADSVVTLEQMQNTKTALEVASSELKVAEFNLRHSKIIAPESGIILKRFAEEGELIGAGNPLFLFGADKEGWVIRAAVTDRQIISLNIGDRAEVRFDAYKNALFPAFVSEFQAVANPYTGTFEVELKLKPTAMKLYSGFIGRVKIVPDEKNSYDIVPVEALVEGDGKKGYVFLADRNAGRVTRLPVRVAAILNDQLLVESGLQEGQEIVTFGSSYLHENSAVEFVDNPPVSQH